MSRRMPLFWWSVLCVLGGLLAMLLGQDASWDYRNYHVYNAWAFLEGRWTTDFVPAQIQTFFNPLGDLPHYLVTQWVSAPFASFVYGAFHTLVLWPVWHLSACLNHTLLRIVVVVGAFFSPVFWYQLGLTVGDATTAVLVVCGLYGLLQTTTNTATNTPNKHRTWGAIAVGAAVGLKLTNAPYGVAMFLVVLWQHHRSQWKTAAGHFVWWSGVGFVLAGGVWYAWVAALYGNPLFPQFNNVFGSPYAAAVGIVDQRWGPKGFLELVFWPLWLVIRPYLFGENNTVALVLSAGLLALYAALPAAWYQRLFGHKAVEASPLVVFFGASYALWLLVFPVGRYLVVLDILAPLLLVGLAQRLKSVAATSILVAFIVLGCALTVYNTDKRDSTAYSQTAWSNNFNQDWLATPKNIVLAGGAPSSWLLPQMGHVAFATHLGGNFQHSAHGLEHIASVIQKNGHPTYWVEAVHESRLDQVHIPSAMPGATQWVANHIPPAYCAQVMQLLGKVFYSGALQNPTACAHAHVQPHQGAKQTSMPDVDLYKLAMQINTRVDIKGCNTQQASLGNNVYTFKVCPSRSIQP